MIAESGNNQHCQKQKWQNGGATSSSQEPLVQGTFGFGDPSVTADTAIRPHGFGVAPCLRGDLDYDGSRNLPMHSLGILLSGRGSNFVAIADSIDAGRIPDARISVVISNQA